MLSLITYGKTVFATLYKPNNRVLILELNFLEVIEAAILNLKLQVLQKAKEAKEDSFQLYSVQGSYKFWIPLI